MCYSTVGSLFRNYGTCYINYVLNENPTETMYIPYSGASKKVLATKKFVLS
jgi:hypothetical protein